jgi:hypothetical protein
MAPPAPPPAPSSQGGPLTHTPQRRWEGTITVTSHQILREPGMSECELDSSYTIDVRLVEGATSDMSDRGGRRIGTRVRLEDGGTTWSGEVKGSCHTLRQNLCNCPPGYENACRNSVLESKSHGTGLGGFELSGWIYYADSGESGVGALYPNGMYTFGAGSSKTSVQSGEILTEAKRCYDTRTHGGMVFAVPYMAIGGMPQPLVTSPLNDKEVRSAASGAMAGNYAYTVSHGPRGAVDVSIRWSLFKGQQWTCLVDEVSDEWRPRHIVMDESAQPVTITATLEEPADTDALFRFTLFDVTQEMGYALNAGDGVERDLRFDLNVNRTPQEGFEPPVETELGYEITTATRSRSAGVKAAAWDYGAWGRVKAEVNFDGAWRACKTRTGKDWVNVPRDDDDNRIADSWEQQHGVSGQPAASDGDALPAGREAGDGFSNYEEYRGFFTARDRDGTGWSRSHGTWASTDPTKKDVFVHDGIGLGVGAFPRTGLSVHLVDADQYNGNQSRVVNFNTGYAAFDPARGQKGLFLHDGPLPAGTAGMVKPDIGSPNVVTDVIVDLAQVEYGDEMLWVIAHELGHAVGLTHPGEYATVDCSGTSRPSVAVQGGVTSGDVSHVMRYHSANYYQGRDGVCYEYPDMDRAGTTFVNSVTGTGLNGGPERRDVRGRPLPIAGDASQATTRVQNLTLKSR